MLSQNSLHAPSPRPASAHASALLTNYVENINRHSNVRNATNNSKGKQNRADLACTPCRVAYLQGLREADEGELGGGVGGVAEDARLGCLRGHHHHPPARPARQAAVGRLHAVRHPKRVHPARTPSTPGIPNCTVESTFSRGGGGWKDAR